MAHADIFCNSPWYELHINWAGTLSFCCHASPRLPYPVAQEGHYNIRNMSIQQWYQSEPMRQARARMLGTESWDHCSRCQHEEAVSTTSRRHRSNQKSVIFRQNFTQSFEQSPGHHKFMDTDYVGMPIDLHIDLGNYCNLACKMCNPEASSRIATQYRAWNMISSPPQDWTQHQPTWNRFLSELITIPRLKNIHFMGGETLIQPKFEECIDHLLAHGRRDVCISFVTNGTLYNQKLVNKLTQFERLGIEVSIETLGASNAYIRQGTDTDQVLANIDRYQELLADNVELTLRPAPSLLSARDYWQVIKLALDRGLPIKSNICTDPEFLAIDVLPREIRQQYRHSYADLLIEYDLEPVVLVTDYNESDAHNHKLVAKNQIVQMLSMLDQPERENTKVQLTRLLSHLTNWDRIYGLNALEVYPELADLFTAYGYQA
jgi:organic radical activating enzyme